MIVQHSPAATLSWQASSNSDGDSILYTVYLGTNPSQLSSIGSTNQTGITTQSLASGGTYYWQVVAQDYYLGIPIQQVLTPVVAFNLNLINNPPGYFSVLTGTGTFETRNSSQTLSWTQAVDPDSDEVYYELSVSTIPEIFSAAQISTATYYNLNFDYGTTYYWLVSAYDGLGGSSTITGSTQTFLPLFIDQPPQMPTLISPFTKSPVVMTMANQVNVSWQKVSDPQNDPITYTLYVGESAADMPALAVINQTPQNQSTPLDLRPLRAAPNVQISVVSQDTSSISVNLTELGYYQNYYMQVAASNLYGATAMTQIQTFSLASSGGFPKAGIRNVISCSSWISRLR